MSPEVILILFQVVVLILAFSVHESAHAYVAMRLGDPTAYMMGRVTLNPLKHLDPWGSILIPAMSLYFGGFLIGWAKPCPITPRNFKDIRRGEILTALAGPASNLAMASIALFLLVLLKHFIAGGMVAIAAAMAVANHVPLDLTGIALFPVAMLLYYGILINLLLFVFNLLPIPPLDGGHLLMGLLPRRWAYELSRLERWGFVIVILLALTGVLGRLLGPVVSSLYNLLI